MHPFHQAMIDIDASLALTASASALARYDIENNEEDDDENIKIHQTLAIAIPTLTTPYQPALSTYPTNHTHKPSQHILSTPTLSQCGCEVYPHRGAVEDCDDSLADQGTDRDRAHE